MSQASEPQAGEFDPAEVFGLFAMREVDSANFDAAVVNAPGSDLRCVFFWGNDCYNCMLFKNTALMLQDQIKALGLAWFHANVYQDEALGRRFGLHGVPAFVFYRAGKRLGRISGWPGLPQFSGAVARLNAGA
ncbi:thioredoxin family protein [Paralcaligenes ureilyticus]|uniref:Thioredoxin n=1 Tax=Paralcaligenes ureilyticus TaxID=627131 RepID=A0A4R3LYB8_9BURK|nr:thioredoxin family protein [Paralcaligenes ureilyticus]TCT03745.1 thioredoxin [Paralcaligenes ureilyticus]